MSKKPGHQILKDDYLVQDVLWMLLQKLNLKVCHLLGFPLFRDN
ncbi:hypothetical protein QG37_06388 [Candidozyma auris]|uniref:Uncharacterized protein n=1 Tax=Candidozyma auris TaxID=498019 RepID=A0A0L0NSM6_CANAR|nr:hypothetical protein QG37_06388 [[Candida] auris]